MGKWIILVVLSLMPFIAHADGFYSQHEAGWFWFDDPKPSHKTLPNQIGQTPAQQMDTARAKLKESLDKAILDPTPDNVKAYIALQNQLSEQSNRFANAWQKVVNDNPTLNYSIEHPTNNAALQVYHQTESQKKANIMQRFAERAGLFFFYRSTCPYCQRFAPIVKHFSETYHITVVPITTDGVSLPEFPNSRQDTGQAQQFNVTVEPALYAVDPITQKAFPVAFGLTSESELLDHIYNFMTQYKEGL